MSEFKTKLEQVRSNAGLMVNVAMNELENQLSGTGDYDVPDANNPFVGLMQTTMLTASMALDQDQINVRMQYATQALDVNSLYHHMDDDQYIGRFSTPAITHYELYLNKDEIISKARAYGDAGARKLVIPRLTQFTTADTVFTLQYPIELRVMSHGGLQVVYDGTDISPLQTLSSNLVPVKEIRTRDGVSLVLNIEVFQMKVDTFTETLNVSSIFDEWYSFTDQFYFARVFTLDNGSWVPVKTTHSDLTYDPDTLTAVLQVVGGRLRVTLPIIYNTTGKVKGTLRIDIYTSKGLIDLDLGSYGAAEIVFNSIDDDTNYTSIMNTLNNVTALNPNRVQGGSNPIDFTTLRNAIINNNRGPQSLPITNSQITAGLVQRGYTLVSNVDNITKRQFLASKRLSNPTDANVISGAGTLMGQLQLSMEAISASEHVKDNGERLTILPSQLYRYVSGRVVMMSDSDIRRLVNSSAETIARSTIENRYLYSPFHYVLDTAGDNFDVRPYYLQAPQLIRKAFLGENATTQLQASVDSYQITKTDAGFEIDVKLKSSDRFKEIADELVVVQLGYKPIGENNFASVNGELIGLDGEERLYRFYINTNFDISEGNGLYTTNLSMYDTEQNRFALNLEHDLIFSVIVNDSITPGYQASDMDLLVQGHLLDTRYMVIGRESIGARFGYDMTSLWRRNRTVLSESSYERYAENVPYVYPENVYARDDSGQIIIHETNGVIQYTILHRKGDPVLDNQGKPVSQYLKGDIKLDSNGKPVLVAARKILREFTLFLVDGLYYFATEAASVAYRNSIADEIRGWINSDIKYIQDNLLENAELFVYPTNTFGDTTATVRESQNSSVTIDQGLNITYFMPPKSYADAQLRPALVRTTKEIVNQKLASNTISISDLVTALVNNGGDDIMSVEVTGLGGDRNFTILTLKDPAVKMSLRKKLSVLANEELMVEDDININFLKHQPV